MKEDILGRFSLGRIVATPGAMELLAEYPGAAPNILACHASGDWGELGEHDRRENDLSVYEGFRILSSYQLDREPGNPDAVGKLPNPKARLWCLTEADRSSTCLLLPSEY